MKKLMILFSLGLLLLPNWSVHGSNAQAKEKAETDFDINKLDRHFEEATKAVNAPSVSVAIFDKNEILFSKSYGRGGGHQVPYAIGSLTKSLTAVGIMKLVEAGKINLDAKLSTYVKNLDYGDKITIKQLLHQDSGLPNLSQNGEIKLKKQGSFEYSNINYTSLAQVIEVVSGQTYNDYMEKEVFSPLGMTKTTGDVDQAIKNGVLDGHRDYFGFNGALPFEEEHPKTVEAIHQILLPGSPDQQVGAGFVSSTTADMAKYLQMYLKILGHISSS